MAVNEQIVTGRKFRKLVDEATKLWQRISFWTKASDVEFNDGSTAETKLGVITGITSDLAGESDTVAASIKAVNQLNGKLYGKKLLEIPTISAKTTYTLNGDSFLNYDELHITIGETFPRCVTFPSVNMDNQRICWIKHIGGNPYGLTINYFIVTIASNVITLTPVAIEQVSGGMFGDGKSDTFSNVVIYGRKYGA